ncbi:hypothetical protein Q4F19_08155 [Sphingomonas sp. BIUV-7]|uniref:Uncharacterized protein n=1 Tax=Sphingomonas natans TaxID=3063330 RepID=A0ABT8Y7R8_9SPHN|nr:hypothetical protein [Sphingomonas sp. BIUV-7]MDO6414350.1 hypothetical protein [Sphingomonas sp. BIUV-7]
MLKLDRGQAAMTLAKRGLGALARFVKAFKLSYGELEASLSLGEIGVADHGDLEADLIDPLCVEMSGTSMASPRVSGVIAAFCRSGTNLSANPIE